MCPKPFEDVQTYAAISTGKPITYTMALLNLLRVLFKTIKIDLSELHALIIINLKKLNADQKSVPEELLIQTILKSDENNFSKKEISKKIMDLLNFHCIDIIDGNVSLKEMILEKY